MMLDFIGLWIYLIGNFIVRIYWRGWKIYTKKKFISCGKNVYLGKNSVFTANHIEIGDDVYIGERASFICAVSKIHIGNGVMFGPNVTIRGGNHRIDMVGKRMIDITEQEKRKDDDLDVWIEDDVWIGCNCTILKGVRIGTGSVVGAGSVVVKDIPPYSIYTGIPAKKIRKRFSEEQLVLHQKLVSNVKDGKNEKHIAFM